MALRLPFLATLVLMALLAFTPMAAHAEQNEHEPVDEPVVQHPDPQYHVVRGDVAVY